MYGSRGRQSQDQGYYPSAPGFHGHHHHHRGHYTFVPSTGGVPHNAVYAGTDRGGAKLYAGRAHHEGDLIPAKVAPNHGGAFVAWGGKEHSKFNYEVLQTTSAAWKYAENGNVPPEALVFGQSKQGENLYMGRAYHDGTITPGKVQPSHRCLYISYGGKEIALKEYEVLVLM